MSAIALRSEDQVGLGVAVAAHVVLIALLAVLAARKHIVIPLPERVVVSLAEDVALTSTAPEPAPDAQAAVADTLTEVPKPKPVEKKPEVKKPDKAKAPPPMQRTTARETPKPKTDQSGGSLVGRNFLEGQGASMASENKTAPATQVGPEVRAALAQAVARQLKPNWQQPAGVDVDKLATTVEWDLNPDGSLAGPPRVIATTGVDASNRPQVGRHQEMAVRAVRLAAPFRLPPDYYSAWKTIKFTFNWELN